jgi:hypothetical protein
LVISIKIIKKDIGGIYGRHVGRGTQEMHKGFRSEDRAEVLGLYEGIILKRFPRRIESESVKIFQVGQDRDQWWDLAKWVMSLWEDFLTS